MAEIKIYPAIVDGNKAIILSKVNKNLEGEIRMEKFKEPKSRQEILTGVLKNCYQAMTRGESQEYTASDGTGIFYSITPQQMAKWDFTADDWQNMDFWLLASEVMENIGIED